MDINKLQDFVDGYQGMGEDDFALFHEDGKWTAYIGNMKWTRLGEGPGVYEAKHQDTPLQAIESLLRAMKND